MPSALLEDGASSACMVAPKAQNARTHPGAPPEQHGRSPWPPQPAFGRPKFENSCPYHLQTQFNALVVRCLSLLARGGTISSTRPSPS